MVNLITNDTLIPKYPKITTVWDRDPDNNYRTLIEGSWAKPEFAYLQNCLWLCREKVDGTNIRVHWDGESVSFGGRTERSQIPPFLLNTLSALFNAELLSYVFGGTPALLYGEGYGNKIQKVGSGYIPDGTNFILFDVLIGDYWLTRSNIEEIADDLGINVVPILDELTLWDAISWVKSGFNSTISETTMTAEGLVLVPAVQLFNRFGERIITKIKVKDFR